VKRTILSLIVILISGVLPIAAQQGNPAIAAYEEWKAKQQEQRPGAAMPAHYCLAAVARRIDAGSARIEFYVVGEMAGLKLQIQPLKIEKLPDGEYRQENAGVATDSQLKAQSEQPLNQTYSMIVTAPVNAYANAYAVQWSLEGSPLKGTNTLVGKLETQPVASVMGILKD